MKSELVVLIGLLYLLGGVLWMYTRYRFISDYKKLMEALEPGPLTLLFLAIVSPPEAVIALFTLVTGSFVAYVLVPLDHKLLRKEK